MKNMRDYFDEIITEEGSGQISLYANFDEPDQKLIDFTVNPDDLVPILPLKGVMLFPNNILPVGVSRKSSQKLVEDALKKNQHIGVFSQTDDSVNKPGAKELYHTGVIAKVIRIIRLPDGEIVDGKVSSWLDYNDSDVVQINIDGKTYLTHYANVCLIHE